MPTSNPDQRSSQRIAEDERIASEPPMSPPDLPDDARPQPMEEHLLRLRQRPQAFIGIVENGVIRVTDCDVKLPEHSRVIIVAI
jgi:hypothetical protein